MNGELTNARKMRGLPWALAHCLGNSIFGYLTVFGSVFMLFLDAVGLNKQQMGLMVSFLPFCGLLALVVAPWVARLGYKRTFLTFYTLRKFVFALLIGLPWVVAWQGQRAAFFFVAAVVLVFAACRAIAETAQMPWVQEYVPDSVRGRFSGMSMTAYTVGGVIAMTFASAVLGMSDEFWRFQWLIAIGVVFGLGAMVLGAMIPGGRSVRGSQSAVIGFTAMRKPLADPNYRRYLAASALYALGTMPLLAFAPLFMKDSVGLEPSQVVLLDLVAMVAGTAAALPWGWAADRFGGKPVCIVSVLLLLAYPVGLLFIPQNSPWSQPVAVALMFVYGLAFPAWHVAANRVFFNQIVPPAHKSSYGSIIYAWWGLFAGLAPLLAGIVIERSGWIEGQWMGMRFDRYTPAIIAFLVFIPAAALVFSRIQVRGEMPALRFVGMFFQGNPIQALSSAISHSIAGEEDDRLATTERLGMARSALNVDELLDALDDPSFNVRHEAINAIARSRPNWRLTNAMIDVLNGNDPDLSLAAAWALGRLRDRAAVEPLRLQLEQSDYPLLAARCARALSMIGDQESIPLLLARLRDEMDDGLRIAYASALGALRSPAALDELLAFLKDTTSQPVRQELTLALARLTGSEKNMVRLRRRARKDRDTAVAQAVDGLHRKTIRAYPTRKDLGKVAREAATAFADNELTLGLTLLDQWIGQVPDDTMTELESHILHAARLRLAETGVERIEYLLLAIDTLDKVFSRAVRARSKTAKNDQ